MKKLLIVLPILFLLVASTVSAHSGRTDSSGGHNCNVGSCAGTYHYHNGGSAPKPVYVAPAPTAKLYVAPVATIKPSTPKPTVAPTETPTSTPEVLSASTETPQPTATPQVEVQGATDTNPIGSLISLGAMGAVAYWAWKKKTGTKETTV